jgi:hypothetical protein
MKRTILIAFMFFSVVLFAQQKDYAIQSVPFTQVKLTDNFWLPRINTNRNVTIPASFERCESTGTDQEFYHGRAEERKVRNEVSF